MTPPGAGRRRQVALFLGALALIAAALALWAQATGGFRVYVLGVPLSVRGAQRPAVVALVLALTALHLLNAWRSRAMATALLLLPRTAPWIAAIAALCVLVGGVRYGSKVASASDPSGYVSQAALWLEGSLKRPQPDVSAIPWPRAEWTFSPLGYRPGDGHTIIPVYPPGLPLLMAAATLIAGSCGPYVIVPLCGALLVWATYSAGSQLSGRAIGLIAALAVAASPTFIFMLVQPMSDLPTAACWTLSMMFAARSRMRRDALMAGVASGIAIMIRPNLAPLAAAPALLTLMTPEPGVGRSRVTRVAMFAAGCAPFIVTVAALFNHLYGSPLRTGYGFALNETYGLANTAPNLSRYTRWFLETQGPAACAFLLTPLVAFLYGGEQRTRRLLYLFFVAGVLGSYLFYAFFEEWWYLRFVLPAFPFVFILAADAVSTITGRLGPIVRGAALLVFAALVIHSGITESEARGVGALPGIERRYADAAQYVQTNLPQGAVVLTMQHSGSLAYYSDKLPFRYDVVAADWIDRAIDHFQGGGRPVYALLDDWEIPLFAERFRGQRAAALVEGQALAETVDGRVKLFAADAREAGVPPVRMPRTDGCLPPAESNLYRR